MTYILTYKADGDGKEQKILEVADEVYQEDMDIIMNGKNDRDAFVAVTDFLPTDMNNAFRKRMSISTDE